VNRYIIIKYPRSISRSLRFFFFLQRKSRKRKFHRLRHFEGEEERSLRIRYVPGINSTVPVFCVETRATRTARSRRDSAYRLPFVEISKFRSSKRISLLPPIFSVSLQPRERGTHACTVRGHICTLHRICLPASVFRERASGHEREREREREREKKENDFSFFSIYSIAPSVLPFAFHSVANRYFLSYHIYYSQLLSFLITSAPIFTK